MEWLVAPEESGSKLQAFLKSKVAPEVAAKQIKRALDAGQCRLNDKVERFGSKLVGRGDRIIFEFVEETIQPAPEMTEPGRYLYIDDDLIGYNKPAGIASDDKAFTANIHQQFKDAILLHRLDRDTTGVLLFARNANAAHAMLALFKQRQVTKTYQAIVDGVPQASSGIVDNFLGKLHVYQGQTLWGEVTKEKGLRARTSWQLEKAGKDVAWLTCQPETGRTHQIRVHLSGIGHPILGDYQYGRTFACPYRPGRMLLHASEIAFEQPLSKQPLVIRAALPHDFTVAVNHLFGAGKNP